MPGTVQGDGRADWATLHSHVRPALHFSRESARLLTRHTALALMGRCVRFDESFLRCLFGHWVYDDQVAGFRRILEKLLGIGTFLPMSEVLRVVRGERTVDGRYFNLSFDDGFDNLYRNALPVLSELGIPCTVFVTTRFMDAPDDEIVSRWWKPQEVRRPTRPMRWAWVAEMVRLGHEIGSHAQHHVRLTELGGGASRLREEIAGSKDELEQRLSVPCRYFSWPFGNRGDIDERGLEQIEAAGYEAAFSGDRGRIVAGMGRLGLPRHHFEPEWPWSHVRYFAAGGGEPS